MKKGKLRAYAGKVNALTEKPCLVCIPPDARDWDDLYRACRELDAPSA